MSVHAHAKKAKLGKTAVLGVMRYMRNQFQMLDLDVRRFSDEAIAAAMVQVRPVVGDLWRLEHDLLAVFQRLEHGKQVGRRTGVARQLRCRRPSAQHRVAHAPRT